MIEKRKYPAIARQTWTNIFFMHWRVDPDSLQTYMKQPYILDTFDGSAWMTVVCFVAKNSQLRGLPFNFVNTAIQINLRTYVTMPGRAERGVYFLKLLLNNKFAASSGRLGVNLPFEYVDVAVTEQENVTIFKSEQERATQVHVAFQQTEKRDKSELADFLVERYSIWHHKHNRLIKIPITHARWRLNHAKANVISHHLHPLIHGRLPDIVHAGDEKTTHLYPYETAGFFHKK